MQGARNCSWETNSRIESIEDSRTGKISFGYDALGNLRGVAKVVLSSVLRMLDTVEKVYNNFII